MFRKTTDDTGRKPKHRARPTILTNHLERVAELEHHQWAVAGLDRPTYRGRHAADTPTAAGGAS